VLRITQMRIRRNGGASPNLVGWASCVLNGALYLNNIAITIRDDGEYQLHFPSGFSRAGVRFYHFNPISRATYDLFREAVEDALEDEEEIA